MGGCYGRPACFPSFTKGGNHLKHHKLAKIRPKQPARPANEIAKMISKVAETICEVAETICEVAKTIFKVAKSPSRLQKGQISLF
jgi:hypothetical protein